MAVRGVRQPEAVTTTSALRGRLREDGAHTPGVPGPDRRRAPAPRRMSAGAAGAVAAWRRRLLDRAGYPPSLAGELAGDERFDVAALVALAERGCPPRARA